MKFVSTLAFALTLASTTARADDNKKAPPPAAAQIDAATVKKFLAFLDKLVDAIVSAKDDCKKMGAGMNALVDANKDLMETARKAQEAGKKLPPDAEKQMDEKFQRAAPLLQKCLQDKDVQGAISRLASSSSSSKTENKPAK